jgi:hypothetical protein
VPASCSTDGARRDFTGTIPPIPAVRDGTLVRRRVFLPDVLTVRTNKDLDEVACHDHRVEADRARLLAGGTDSSVHGLMRSGRVIKWLLANEVVDGCDDKTYRDSDPQTPSVCIYPCLLVCLATS